MSCGLHLAGAVFFAWKARELVQRAGVARRRAAALAVFAGSGVLVLGISACYHVLGADHPWKAVLQRADHAAVFLLIAGTLTPYYAIAFHGRGRWWMLGCSWAVALAALVLKIVFWSDVGDRLGLILYIGLAASGVVALLLLPRRLPWVVFLFMTLGGLVYTAGGVVDYLDAGRLVPGWFGPHELLHVLVLVALLMHWRIFHYWSVPGRVPPLETVGSRVEPFASPSAGS